jgi:hypothetical protein
MERYKAAVHLGWDSLLFSLLAEHYVEVAEEVKEKKISFLKNETFQYKANQDKPICGNEDFTIKEFFAISPISNWK